MVKLIIFVIVHIVSGFIAKSILREKGYPDHENQGFVLGLIFGLIGVYICYSKAEYKKPGSSSGSTYRSVNYTTSYNTQRNTYQYNTPKKPYSSSSSRTVTKQNFATKLNSLRDAGDVGVQISPQQQKRVSEAKKYHASRRRTYTAIKSNETISIDLSWSENLAELLEATEVVYTNADLNCKKRLVSEKFNYYINLHYRSFTAADLCHAKREEIMEHLNNLKKIISRLNDRNDYLRVDKTTYDQLISLRSNMYDLVDYLAQRRDTLNKQTGTIRDKIRDECGERGRRWYNELMERAKK